ncbi:cytochrome c-type biogenesis protein [Vibrio fluvialis]|uniref:cytochrome c-type biogenesis protein n=1 Tax=Vibrio fluvialis TaxID=676 RepID=UPI000CEB6187|nr:cytochrome c-type biogenesis protein [Vibrio fluvialis]AVH33188.1 cytochrome c-type biogenesis protein CcmH [Vibrio fluvialis]MBY8039937.1 cytochrome c-type biogenesis protein CcmH [Vibrio fluvialis]MBY8072797.1 cytochrome c-type biogenesis protein CcmH [Vibrio fluvialis]TOY92920.1 cytochrome c-type biogenesis protein CcmH [Vibrio fluvialis]TRN12192.1 cytochrome c-type biogenesis protein CcmH [Vibrio fluvialis]
MKRWILAAAAALMVSLTALAAIDVYDFDTPEQETQFQELSNTLRCPKCQNNSIADSNAELAKDLRHKVYEMTKEGKSKDEIVDYMIARYGNFVTYNPPFTLSTAILWLGPVSVLLIGFGVIVIRSRRSKTAATSNNAQWDRDKEARLKALLEEDKDGDKQ